MEPKLDRSDRSSNGPKEATPSASIAGWLRKNSMTRPSVSVGKVVSILVSETRSSGPVPTAHSHFVPPASIDPRKAPATCRIQGLRPHIVKAIIRAAVGRRKMVDVAPSTHVAC